MVRRYVDEAAVTNVSTGTPYVPTFEPFQHIPRVESIIVPSIEPMQRYMGRIEPINGPRMQIMHMPILRMESFYITRMEPIYIPSSPPIYVPRIEQISIPSIQTISTPHWVGETDVKFKVTDPDGASDSTVVKATVNYPSSVEDLDKLIPITFCLEQNYPNPFNSQTTIYFGLPKPSEVIISVYNLNGQLVAELFKGRKHAGYHSVTWEAYNSSAGTYFIKMQADDFVQTRKCILLK